MPHTHGGAGESLVVLALLWTPLALFLLTRFLQLSRRWRSMALHTRAALFLMLVSAITHAALIPDHAHDPLRQTLFGLDAVALVILFLSALARIPGWRLVARLLLASAVGAYCYYVSLGWETVDVTGLFTKIVELVTIGLLWLPDDPVRFLIRNQFRRYSSDPFRSRT